MAVPPRNNDDVASCQHVHVYKHHHCVVLQFASASLNDPLMSAAEVHPLALRGDVPWAAAKSVR